MNILIIVNFRGINSFIIYKEGCKNVDKKRKINYNDYIKENKMIKLDNVELYDLKELCKKLQLTRVTVMLYLRQGKIKGKKIGGKWYVTKENLKDYLRK